MRRDLSDSELVDRFKSGDQAAYAEIVRRYQDRVYGLAYRWMSDEQIAREVTQDAFVAIFKALPRFRGESQLSTWIFRVVVNHCKNRRQYRRRRRTGFHEPLEGRAASHEDAPRREFAGDGPLPDAGADASDAKRLVDAALNELDDEFRVVLVLRDIEDRSYEEIAELLGMAKGTVKSRLHRARAQLAKVLARSVSAQDVL